MAYDGAIATLPGKEKWIMADDGLIIGAPNSLRPRGRPKKQRIKSFLEDQNSKGKSVHKCGRCGLWGHHRSTCKNPLNKFTDPLPPVEAIVGSSSNNYGTSGTFGARTKLSIRREELPNDNEDYDSSSE